ncbi:MAG TPA: contractile injection system protein, VgrG/Pvc8 family, partial [Nannocystaceae bacterium]|nr:contractile injection system protein, VgrG/Pvc8 family [Nannocystaceae bacterium]
MELIEAIGEPYTLLLDLVATEDGDDPLAWPGAEAELVMRGGEIERTVRGIVTEVELRGATGDGRTIASIRVVPALALAAMRIDSRIFQHLGAHQIVGEVLGGALGGWGRSYLGRYSHDHPTREYCVQYRESDLDFARRLLEDDGLFFVFEQPDDEPERVVLLDDASALPLVETADGKGELALTPDTLDVLGYESVHAFEWRQGLRPTGVVSLEHDPLHPEAPVVHARRTDEQETHAREHYVHEQRR